MIIMATRTPNKTKLNFRFSLTNAMTPPPVLLLFTKPSLHATFLNYSYMDFICQGNP
jgi:hypothetical protein